MKPARRPFFRSISSRYITFYLAGLIALVLIFIVVFFRLSDTIILDQQNTLIQSQSDSLVESYQLGGQDDLTRLLWFRLKNNPHAEGIYLLTDKTYRPVLGNIADWPDNIPRDQSWGEIDWGDEDSDLELRYYHRELKDGRHLLVGQINRRIEDYWVIVHMTFLASVIGTLVLGALGGLVLHRRLKSRFDDMMDNCQRVGDGQLSLRMPVGLQGDEIDQMSHTLNMMLDRIENLMGGIQHVTNNIAHDLRTPLARLRNRLEDLTKRNQEPAIDTDIRHALQEVDDLLSTFQSLLNISRLEAGQTKRDFSPVALHDICTDIAELYEPLADEKRQELNLDIEAPASIQGDRDLIFQCLANIVDNAIKYGSTDGKVGISLKPTKDGHRLSVSDTGPGIPPEEQGKVFDRFYRVEKSRHQKGNGLGLSLVAAIAHIHGATISLENNPGLHVHLDFSNH